MKKALILVVVLAFMVSMVIVFPSVSCRAE
jgi:hypothetical protein